MRDVTAEDTIFISFTTRAFATGIPTVLAGTPVVSAYEDAGLTQITAGITLGVDHDGVVGLNMLTIVATAANGYDTGKDYQLVITTGTVGGVSVVGEVVGQFTIERSAAAVDLANATDGLTVLKSELDGIQADTEDIQTRIPAALSSGNMKADVLAISTDTGAADNLEAMYDGTGYIDDTAPSSRSQLDGLSNTGSAVHRTASSYVLTTGTQSANTVAATAPLDGTRHEHTDAGGLMDLYYEFLIGNGTPTACTVTGYLNGNNDDLEVYGFDWVASAWVQIGVLEGKTQATNDVNPYDLFVNMVGSGSDEGKVRIRFTDGAFTLTTATLAIDQIFVAYSQGAEGYENGAIWIDTNVSNTNTVRGTDGVSTNPVSTIGAANTLAALTNLNKFSIAPGSTITLAAAQNNQVFIGENWTLALGGQDVAGTTFIGAVVTGVMAGTGTDQHFIDCELGAISIIKNTHFVTCEIEGTQTVVEAGDIFYERCGSAIAGTATPLFSFGAAIGNSNLSMRKYSGGIQFEAMGDTGTDTASIEGRGQIIEGTCTGGTVAVRGLFTTSGITNLTLSDDARYDVAQINAQVDGAWTTQMADSVSADGSIATREQALRMALLFLTEFAITGVTYSVKKEDGTTEIMTFTLDDGTTPTSITRAT